MVKSPPLKNTFRFGLRWGPEFAPYSVPGGQNQLQGGGARVCYLIPLSSCLEALGTLLPYPGSRDSSLPQGGQGLLPYPFQGGLSSCLEA